MVPLPGEKRRKELLEILRRRKAPVTGSELAGMFSVSRQVIVQDVALLRAEGVDLVATPRGYILAEAAAGRIPTRVIACRHNGIEELRDELLTITGLGGKVIDVIVEHPLYGELRGMLMTESADDVEEFVRALSESDAKPLSVLTEGVHLHTIQAATEAALDNIERALAAKGYLFEKAHA
ncbi:MAG TPA: transcription repressor NadR [Firmicutes bacterium]|nr:transcription repressor NadR [Bacillota bacterium]